MGWCLFISGLVGLYCRTGLDDVANKVLPAKRSAKGLKQGQTLESFVRLSALGGDCLEDIHHLGYSYCSIRKEDLKITWDTS